MDHQQTLQLNKTYQTNQAEVLKPSEEQSYSSSVLGEASMLQAEAMFTEMEDAVAAFDPFLPTFVGNQNSDQNTLIEMFNKQKSKSENYKILMGKQSVGCVKSLAAAEASKHLTLEQEVDPREKSDENSELGSQSQSSEQDLVTEQDLNFLTRQS